MIQQSRHPLSQQDKNERKKENVLNSSKAPCQISLKVNAFGKSNEQRGHNV